MATNSFWIDSWGERPRKSEDAVQLVKEKLSLAPKLVRLFVHRFLPTQPNQAGNPVLSIYGTDAIYYGSNLANYFRNEFGSLTSDKTAVREIERNFSDCTNIPFWSNLIELN